MLNTKPLPIALLAYLTLSQGAIAQQPPLSGGQIQQVQPGPTLLPPAATSAPALKVEPIAAPAAQANDGVKIQAQALRITGATVFTEAELIAVAGFQAGSELTLGQLRAMVQRIESYLQDQGYFLARAFLPAQDIKGGVVAVTVVEGRYGKLVLRNSTNLSFSLANNLLVGINKGDVVSNAALERSLLLLSDLPGVQVKSTLVPGTESGTSDLVVDITPGKLITGSVDFDNSGNTFTGKNRIGATVNLNNPFGQGDVLSLRALTTTQGMDYGRVGYTAQAGQARVGAAVTALAYRLDFQGQALKGSANIASLYASYPLIRSREKNLYAQVGFDSKRFRDSVTVDGNKQARVVMASLSGDFRDTLGGAAVSSYMLSASAGSIDLQTPEVRTRDATTTQRNGSYSKLGLSAQRVQRVTNNLNAFASLRGQIASKNLDSSEKLSLGGANAVRAYPEGEAPGDQGYVLSLEAQLALTQLASLVPGQVQLVGFYDTASITLNKKPWDAAKNRRDLSGAGLGLNWTVDKNFLVKTYYARKLGNEPAMSAPDTSGRFGLQVIKQY
jgi:hemolysin activation/secretion protein